ncbi:hypothetical protein [Rubrivivax sp. JA1026]|uniref:hypothetical protein n=1 Tax=Rubrivivax sp. JA1026 TaxID=2710888 RepID=UPI00385758A9
MEARSGADHRVRRFQEFDHTLRLMARKLVVPYCMNGRRSKNDAADAGAICEALQRPAMRFVPVKSTQAQARSAAKRTARRNSMTTLDAHKLISLLADNFTTPNPLPNRKYQQQQAATFLQLNNSY